MTTKVIFNIDKKLKESAMKKAKRDGLTLSAVLNIATRKYVDDQFKIALIEREIEEALRDVREGRTIPAEEVYKKLGL
jgi:antitoxin component of RelBE/YafQ-DinJ toxin-antitoxin module